MNYEPAYRQAGLSAEGQIMNTEQGLTNADFRFFE